LMRLALGASIRESFEYAQCQFLIDFLSPMLQCPQAIVGTAWEEPVAGRFVPGLLPDIVPPEILGVSASVRLEASERLMLRVAVSDNRDRTDGIRVESRSYTLDGQLLESAPLSFVSGEEDFSGELNAPPLPGFFLEIVAQDSSNNLSDPLIIWVSRFEHGLFFDMDGNGIIDENDLILWIDHDRQGTEWVYPGWLYDFTQSWRNFSEEE
jgi:hypothetical protein